MGPLEKDKPLLVRQPPIAMPDPVTTGTEDELIAAALALVAAKHWLERVKVRQAAPSELRKAEDKIEAARERFDSAAEAHVDALRAPPTP